MSKRSIFKMKRDEQKVHIQMFFVHKTNKHQSNNIVEYAVMIFCIKNESNMSFVFIYYRHDIETLLSLSRNGISKQKE